MSKKKEKGEKAMKEQEGIDRIIGSMESFQAQAYTKEERLREMLKLQRETVETAFSDKDETFKSSARLWDVLEHLKRENQAIGFKANDEIAVFERDCREIGHRIAAELSGNRGEEKAYRRLQHKGCPGIILRNLQLSEGDYRTEVDLAVITGSMAFVIEVKNTRLDIYIDEVGDQYRLGKIERFDTRLGDKMDFRKKLVKRIAAEAGFPEMEVQSIVCYTDSRIKVYNHCESIRTCGLGKLPYLIIEHEGAEEIGDEGIRMIADALQEASQQERYPMDYDIEGFKNNFARAVCAVEVAKKKQGSLGGRFEAFFRSVLDRNVSRTTSNTELSAA